MPDYPDAAYVTLAPDWVCEVLSPSTRKLDLHGKRPIYAREGAGRLWLVDAADRTLEAFEMREGHWVLIATAKDADPVCIRPFDAVTFSLGDLWPREEVTQSPRSTTGALPNGSRLRIMYVARARPFLCHRPVRRQRPQKSTHAVERLVVERPVAPLSRHAHRYVRMRRR